MTGDPGIRALAAGEQMHEMSRGPMHRRARRTRRSSVPLVLGLAAALVLGACGGSDGGGSSAPSTIPQPTRAEMVAAGLDKLPLAPQRRRLDIVAPTFSDPTRITNPLFPIGRLRSAIFSGRVDGKPFHTETTLLPETRILEWSPGQRVEARVSQYFAYLDGRIEEVALDYYAQADTARSGTSARTSTTTTAAASSTAPSAVGWQGRKARPR